MEGRNDPAVWIRIRNHMPVSGLGEWPTQHFERPRRGFSYRNQGSPEVGLGPASRLDSSKYGRWENETPGIARAAGGVREHQMSTVGRYIMSRDFVTKVGIESQGCVRSRAVASSSLARGL